MKTLSLSILLLVHTVCIAQIPVRHISFSNDSAWSKYPSVLSHTDNCGITHMHLSNCDSAYALNVLHEEIERLQKANSKNYRALQAAVHFINTLPDHLKRSIYYESYQCQLDKTGSYTRGKRKENETEKLILCEE